MCVWSWANVRSGARFWQDGILQRNSKRSRKLSSTSLSSKNILYLRFGMQSRRLMSLNSDFWYTKATWEANSTIYSDGLSTWTTRVWVNVLRVHACVCLSMMGACGLLFLFKWPKTKLWYSSTNHINHIAGIEGGYEAEKNYPSIPLSSMCTIYALSALTCIQPFIFSGEVYS